MADLVAELENLRITTDENAGSSAVANAEALLATPTTEAELGGAVGMPQMQMPGSDEIDKDSDVTGKLFVGK